jgi:transcriptional regulator with XRE-family HTH domain
MPYGKYTDISARIREVRGKLKQAQFADILGIPRPNLSKYESGRQPPADVLQKIADYGGVTVKWLLTGKKEKKDKDQPTTPERPPPSLVPGPPVEIQEFLFTEVLRAVEDFMKKFGMSFELEFRARLLVALYNHCARELKPPSEELIDQTVAELSYFY